MLAGVSNQYAARSKRINKRNFCFSIALRRINAEAHKTRLWPLLATSFSYYRFFLKKIFCIRRTINDFICNTKESIADRISNGSLYCKNLIIPFVKSIRNNFCFFNVAL